MASKHASKAREAELMEVVRLLPDVLFRCFKADDGKIYWNLNEGGLAEEFHLTTDEIRGKSLDELFPGGASSELHAHFEEAFQGHSTVFTNQIGDRHFRHFPQAVRDADGHITEVVGFIADVTALVEAERRLAEANTDLEAFAHSVSHDLRGPLSTLRLDAHRLAKQAPDDKARRTAERMERQAERLIGTVKALLDLGRATRAQMTRQAVDVTAMAKDVTAELDQRDTRRKVAWDIAAGITVEADPDLIQIILQNLLENAWKFTGDDARIRVAQEGNVVLVQDNGPGFAPEDGARIFEPFTRLGTEREGSGIGLSTVQRIVQRHGGAITAQGEPGKGAVFRFTLAPA